MKTGKSVDATRPNVGSVKKNPFENKPAVEPIGARASTVKSMNHDAAVLYLEREA